MDSEKKALKILRLCEKHGFAEQSMQFETVYYIKNYAVKINHSCTEWTSRSFHSRATSVHLFPNGPPKQSLEDVCQKVNKN